MDTEEMYRRGMADAEDGDFHPFYYQHYYHYRRGYDRTRRRLRGPDLLRRGPRRSLMALSALAMAVLGLVALGNVRMRVPQLSTAQAAQSPIPTHTLQPAPTSQPIFPTATPPPPTPVMLHAGGQALVSNTKGQALRARRNPSLTSPVQVTFKEGEQVHVLEGPVEADSYVWWRVEGTHGSGWSAERSKEGQIWLQPVVE